MKNRAESKLINLPWHDSTKVASFNRRLRNIIACYPRIYIPAIKFTSRRDFVIRRNTELVIEGYPRSGNSFAHAAFRLAQNRPISIAHHCHAPAQVMMANRWKIPALVIFRDPDDAVRSLLIFSPEMYTVNEAYREYINFYQPLLKIRDSYVLASFESVTKELSAVIRCVNERFETEFKEFSHSEEMVNRAFTEVNRIARETSGANKPAYDILQREEYRSKLSVIKTRIQNKIYEDKAVAKLRAQAKKLHKTLLDLSDL